MTYLGSFGFLFLQTFMTRSRAMLVKTSRTTFRTWTSWRTTSATLRATSTRRSARKRARPWSRRTSRWGPWEVGGARCPPTPVNSSPSSDWPRRTPEWGCRRPSKWRTSKRRAGRCHGNVLPPVIRQVFLSVAIWGITIEFCAGKGDRIILPCKYTMPLDSHMYCQYGWEFLHFSSKHLLGCCFHSDYLCYLVCLIMLANLS